MEINRIDLNDKVISEQGMLYYLSECTDFLCDLPEWMFPHIEAELAGRKSMHQYYEEAKGNIIEEEDTCEDCGGQMTPEHPIYAPDGPDNGNCSCHENEDAEVKSKTWIGDGHDPLLTIIIHEVEGIPEIAFAGSNELAEKVWNRMMMNVDEMEGHIVGCDYNEDVTTSNSWDEGFFGYGDDIFRKEYKTLNGAEYPGEGVEVADGDKIRAIRPGTKMPVTILTCVHSGIPETWFVGSDEEAKKIWDEAMADIESQRDERAKRDGEEPDYSCDMDSNPNGRTTKNAWEAGYFCDHKDEFRVDGYQVEVA